MSPKLAAVLALLLIAAISATAAHGAVSVAQAAATCSDYSTQADAQAAADTSDGDDDGIYCESLPCPCAGPSGSQPTPTPSAPAPERTPDGDAAPRCSKPKAVQRISFSKTKYRSIREHYLTAVRRGWPRILVLNRPGADARRDRLLEHYATKPDHDRDEYPPAIGRGKGKGLARGTNPRGWRANVEFVRSSENRSHGSRLGIKLRRFCNGTKFRYIFY